MPTVEGFAPLILALPTIAEPSPRYIQKGTHVVPPIPGLDPLILPRYIQGIFRALGPEALEAILPSPVFIGPKIFSLAPNVQTQKGVVTHMSKPFPYQDSYRVLWKYDRILIST